jgi:hypothetical protein
MIGGNEDHFLFDPLLICGAGILANGGECAAGAQ